MSGEYFVDSNVFVYARDSSEPKKQPRAEAWLKWLWSERQGAISVQVLSEYYTVVTYKLDPGLPANAAREDVRNLRAWNPLSLDDALIEEAWSVEDRFGFSWWDSLIVSAAQRLDCRYLLTEDLQHGQDLGGLEVLSPFESDPPTD